MTGYAKNLMITQQCIFFVKDKKLLKSYTKIWETIEKLMKIKEPCLW